MTNPKTDPSIIVSDAPRGGTGTNQAIATLVATKPLLIQWGQHIAVQLALKKRTVHSREVWDELRRAGIITEEGKAFWLGAVFRELKDAGVLKKTGHTYSYSDEARGIHERTVALWELNEEADLTEYRVAPTKRP